MAGTLTFLLVCSLLQDSSKDVQISVSPSAPISENQKVTLTCSSNAQPAVENYTWCRADGGALIGTGHTLNITVSTINSNFFCNATNTVGFKASINFQIVVRYSPKNITVSVSPSGPVPENSNVTLTCSSNANPAVRNYTWYRADGDQETFIGTGSSFNVTVSKVKSTFFCKATNALGCERSRNLQIDVQYSPKNVTVSVSPSGPVPENSNVTLTCSSNANPAVENYTWYRADGDQEAPIGTGSSFNVAVSKVKSSFFCKATNALGCERSRNLQIDVQYSSKDVQISVSPSAPISENQKVTLTCSSNAQPAVENYTWCRADGGALIGTGHTLNITVSTINSNFFCNATNTVGFKASINFQIVVRYSPKNITVSVSPSGPVPENSNVTLTCSSNANPAVRNYTWYRADGDQEALIGTGHTLNITVSTINNNFFCKATNTVGFKASINLQIDIQYSPKNVTVSVSPSGPVPENSNVTLTCSSNANPAVRNYTWYRADGDQETFIGTGSSFNVTVSKVKSSFFCKATNALGCERSSNLQIDVQYSPKNITVSVSPSGPVPENSNMTLTCSSNANPAVRNYTWYRADGDQETFIGTGSSFNVTVSKVKSSFFCKATNALGCERSRNLQIDVQYSPKNVTVSVSPSGPVPENSNVTLTCSSNANPAVRNYTWYRADGDQEAPIGTRSSFNVTVSKVKSSFFCKATNALGCERSSNLQIDVQYSPKNITVSVSPSGPVPENSNVTLTCSSDANPAVRNYTWYRADGNQETFIGTGMSSSIKVCRDTRALFCKAENEIGVGRSRNMQIEVQYPPQILLSSHCSSTQSQLNCSCETLGNPSPTIQWYLNELPVNHSKCEIFNQTLNRTILRSFFTLNQPHKKDRLTLLCRSFNSLGSASQQFCVSSQQISTEHQLLYPAIISTLAVLLLALLLYVFFIRVQKNPCKNKGHLTDENNTTATSQPLTEEGNEEPNTTEECIYANADGLRRAENLHPANIAGPSSTDLPSSGPKNAEGGCKKSDKKGDENELIYSNVNWKTKSKKKKGWKIFGQESTWQILFEREVHGEGS
uniref:Ig-like domain-containing protein n=1 Tax=Oreochromis aureus TaxID=47969 RepID=A0AAZ1X8T2_OREAU